LYEKFFSSSGSGPLGQSLRLEKYISNMVINPSNDQLFTVKLNIRILKIFYKNA